MTEVAKVMDRLRTRADFLQKFVKRAEAHIRLRSSESLVATLTAHQEEPLAVWKKERIEALMRPQTEPNPEAESIRRIMPSWEEKIEDAKRELSNIDKWMAALEEGGMQNIVEDVSAANLLLH